MTIEQGNKLIAEFMGAVIRGSSVSKDYEYAVYRDNEGFEMLTVRMDNLEYHSSWDWLMPVVEKIKIWFHNNYDSQKAMATKWANIQNALTMVNRSEVWKETVQFIEWYNENKGK